MKIYIHKKSKTIKNKYHDKYKPGVHTYKYIYIISVELNQQETLEA